MTYRKSVMEGSGAGGGGGGAPVGAQYVVAAAHVDLTSERVLLGVAGQTSIDNATAGQTKVSVQPHLDAADPHPQYTTAAEASTAAAAAAASAVATHEAATDPHPQYTSNTEATALAEAVLDAHEGLADPHTQYATDTDFLNHVADLDAGGHKTANQEAALAGTNGTPSGTNKFVTDSDPRNTNARTPTAHTHDYATEVTGKPATFPPSTHTHDYATEVTGKPATFPPSAHTHNASDVNAGTLDIARLPTGTTGSTVALGNHTHTGVYDPAGAAAAAISAHEAASDPHAGYQKESEKGVANGYASLGADGLVPSAQLPASSGGGYTPAWVVTGAGVRYLAYSEGNPADAIDAFDMASQAGPTATAVGTGIVRLVKFRLPKQLTVSALRIFYIATGVNVFSFAVYRVSDGARMFNTGLLTAPAANTWGNFAVAGSPVLAAGVEYWLAMGVSAANTTNTFRSWPQLVNAAIFGAHVAPLGTVLGMPTFAQAAVTIGATPTWPATLPAVAAAAYVNATTGTIPAVLLEGTAA